MKTKANRSQKKMNWVKGIICRKGYAKLNFRDKGAIRECVFTEAIRIGPELWALTKKERRSNLVAW